MLSSGPGSRITILWLTGEISKSHRGPLPQSREQTFGTCSAGGSQLRDAEDAMASHPELLVWWGCNSRVRARLPAIMAL